MNENLSPSSEKDNTTKDRQFVIALERGLDVLRVFDGDDFMLGNKEISERTGLPRPTVSRMTHTLLKLGYLEYVNKFEKYQLGPSCFSLGYRAMMSIETRDVARPFMQELADYTQTSVSLGAGEGMSMMYIENCRGKATLTLNLSVGSRLPILRTAMGLAYFVGLSPAKREEMIRLFQEKNPEELKQCQCYIDMALEQYKNFGFVVNIGTWNKNINAVGIPVVSQITGKVKAITCGGASFLITEDMIRKDFGEKLVKTGKKIEQALMCR